MKGSDRRPPAFLRRLLKRLVRAEDRGTFPDELEEIYRDRVRTGGAVRADVWYLWQVIELGVRRALAGSRALSLSALTTGGAGFLRELRHVARGLLRRPVFPIVAVLSLGIGIGANTAVFALIDEVLLSEPPVERPDELVEVYTSDADGQLHSTFSYPDFQDVAGSSAGVFEGVAGYELFFATTERAGTPVLLMGEAVSADFFGLLGVDPVTGRGFLAGEDDVPDEGAVAVLSHDFWSGTLGGDPAVVGSTLRINRRPYTVIGIAPPDFEGLTPALVPDVWVPISMIGALKGERLGRRGSRSMFVTGRLADGTTAEEADRWVRDFSAGLAERYPETNEGRTMTVVPSEDVAVHPAADRALVPVAFLLLGVVGIVLAVTCTNVASFLLSRAEEGRREVAVRRALGAGRTGLVLRFLLQVALLTVVGGVLALGLARGAIDLLVRFQPPIPLPLNLSIELGGSVFAFTAAVTVVATFAAGLLPALRSTGGEVGSELRRSSSPEGAGPRGSRLRNALVVSQVALSCVLLVGAGLFVRSLRAASSIDPGFHTGPAAILWPELGLSGVPEDEGPAVWRELITALESRPEIDGVALTDALPLGAGFQSTAFDIPGQESERPDGSVSVDHATVSASFFEVMEVDIVRGRLFEESQSGAWDGSIVVSRAFEERYFPEGAMGRTLDPGSARPLTIVGVAEDTKVRTLGESPRPRVYFPMGWSYLDAMQLVARGDGSSGELLGIARRALRDARPGLVFLEAKTMEEHLAFMLFAPRTAAFLLTALGGLALFLAVIGLYGTVRYAAVQRSREMGIRLSLGAAPSDVRRLVVTGGVRLVVAGGVVGLAISFLAGSLLSGFLIGVEGRDVVTFVAIPGLLAVAGLIASWLPARRATRVDPVEVLRA